MLLEISPIDPRDKTVKRLCSAIELLDQVWDVFEDPDLDEGLYLNHLCRALNEHGERRTDPGYEGFGGWCDGLMAELPQLIAQAAESKSFVIAVEGTSTVKVVPLGPENGSGFKLIGFLRGQINVPDDFDSMGM